MDLRAYRRKVDKLARAVAQAVPSGCRLESLDATVHEVDGKALVLELGAGLVLLSTRTAHAMQLGGGFLPTAGPLYAWKPRAFHCWDGSGRVEVRLVKPGRVLAWRLSPSREVLTDEGGNAASAGSTLPTARFEEVP